MGLFKTIKETGKIMGDVFESKMPEEHYIEKISDLQYQLHSLESILEKIVKGNLDNIVGYEEAIEYLKRHSIKV